MGVMLRKKSKPIEAYVKAIDPALKTTRAFLSLKESRAQRPYVVALVFVLTVSCLWFPPVFPVLLAFLHTPLRSSRLLRIQTGVYFVPGLNTYVNA